jgi:glycosyltransferase involved in cell wall biosynthesis
MVIHGAVRSGSGIDMPRLLYIDNLADHFCSHRLPLARAALAAGWMVSVATPPSPAVARILDEGFGHHAVPIDRRGLDPRADLGTLRALVRLYREVRPDLVHLRTIKPVLYGGIAARVAAVPAVVSHVTGLGHAFLARGVRAAALRAGLRPLYRAAFGHRCQRVVFQNGDDRRAMLGMGLLGPGRTAIVRGSGVDPAVFAQVTLPEASGAPLVVFPARLLWDKGVGDFVAAAGRLRAAGIAARCVLVGDCDAGNRASATRAEVEAWQAAGVIEWWGQRSDMPAVFAASRIVCLPSHWEGLPKALLEAASCGRAIVTADTPGCREVVRDGDNGLLVPARDPAALAAALARLLADPQACRRMGERGRQRVLAEFTVERVTADMLAVYRDLAERAGLPQRA